MKNKKYSSLLSIVFLSLILISNPVYGKNIFILSETIDQSQVTETGGFWIDKIAWQEFQPQVKKLIKIEVKIMSGGGNQPQLNLFIEKPLGTIIKSKQIQGLDISTTPGWVIFDIDDINLDIGEKYYIKLSFSPGGLYYWFGANNNPYINGISNRGESWDWCFKTIVDKSQLKNTFNLVLFYHFLNLYLFK